MNSSANWLRGSLLGRLAVPTIILLVSLCCLPGAAWAQSTATGGQIVGQVLDTSGAAIGGAEVTVRNKNTNLTRNVTTDEQGRYSAPLLPVGPYEVKVSANGFEPGVQEVIITLGSTIGANFNLSVGASSEVIEVTGQAVELSVDPSRTSTQSVITDLQIRELPSNGRRFADFILLTPQALTEPERGGISLSGQRGINVNINIDGADYNQPFFGGLRGGERANNAFTVSQEAIQEFQVTRNSFSAEFGRSTGGVVNVITKSGTNQFHGSAFFNIRNESLTAEDALGRKPLAKQQQFGGSIGGPLVKDRTFFFAALDFQNADEPVQVLFTVLDSPTQRVNGVPLRNTPGAQALLAVAKEEPFEKTNDAQAVLARIDHRLFGNNNLSARFNFSNNKGDNAVSAGGGVNPFTNSALTNNGIERDRTYTFVTQLTSVISPRFLNEFRFQYSREQRPRINNSPGPEVTALNNGTTVAVYGQRAFLPIEQFDDRFQVTNNISLILPGGHTTKIGFDFNRAFVDQIFRSDAAGVYRFNSLTDYLARRPSQYRQFAGSGQFDASQKELAFYVQDEWRIFRGVTLTPGFRYEATFNPELINASSPATRFPAATEISDDLRQFAPRMGVAWDIGNTGKNVLRFGGGLFYARTPLLLFNQAITNNGGNLDLGRSLFLGSTSAVLAAFASQGVNLAGAPLGNLPVFSDSQLTNLLLNSPIGALTVGFFDPKFRNPRASQFNVSFERQIMRGLTASIDFSYINTTRLERLRDLNLPTSVIDATGRRIYSGIRPNSKFGVARIQESSSRALYRAMTASVNFRRSRFVFDAYYTLASNYSDDDNERNFAGIQYDNAFALNNEYNFARIDQRHQFNFNGAVSLPLDFQLSGTSRVASGRPINATAGSDINRDGQNTDRPIVNGKVFKRNSFRNQSFADISFKAQKSFKMPSEKGKVSVSIEMFNLLNFDNAQFAGPALVFGPGTALVNGKPVTQAPLAGFMRLRDNKGNYLTTTTLGDPFTVQLSFRYTF